MKIHETNRELGIASNSTGSLQGRRLDPAQEGVAPVEEQMIGEAVSISPASVEISKAAEMMEKESPERVEKIRALQKAVQEGTYQVDPAKIAEKMILDSLS